VLALVSLRNFSQGLWLRLLFSIPADIPGLSSCLRLAHVHGTLVLSSADLSAASVTIIVLEKGCDGGQPCMGSST